MNELLQKRNILIVDDDEDDFFIVSDYIRSIPGNSFQIDWAASYKTGLELLTENKYDLYFVDYRLGAKSGVDLLKEAQGRGCDAPIILLTGQGNYAVDIEATKSGAADYLIKAELNTEKTERCIRYALGRAQTLNALKTSENKFRSIFEKSKDIIFVTDRTLKITDINDAITQLLGYTRKDTENMVLTDIVDGSEAKEHIDEVVKRSGTLNDYPITLSNHDGSKVPCTISLSAENTDAEHGYVQGIIHDITNLKRAEKAAMQTEKLAATGRLVRTLAHEIRNPLNNISMSGEYLQSIIKDDDAKLYLDIIQRNSHRINTLINELLQSANPRDNTLKQCALQETINEVIAASADRLTLKKIVAQVQLPEEPVKILADRENLKLALLNIVINAVEAMDENVGVLKVNLHCDDHKAILAITDNGCGLNEEHITRIFEPYFTRKKTGAGLGLAFTLNILKAHKAGIDVTSAPGKGTVFTITFPLGKTVIKK
jgi:PAS domain S-box-containing protein